MLLNFFLWSIFLTHLVYSGNVTSINNDIDKNKTLNVKKIPTEVITNHTQMAMESEGGPILHDVPATALPKTNLMLELMNLDKEMGKIKEKPIQARKGVENPMHVAQNDIIDHNDTKSNNTLKQKFEMALKGHEKAVTVPPSVAINDTVKQEQTKVQNATKIEAHKKPLKVSYQALAKLEEKFDSDMKIPFVKSSPKTKVNDQMPSPNKETNTKIYSMATQHPGMVTPIVITILVVPMFAVLGYMAIKRGQEAWKNRHYKRMDFLLDGMYND
ncbi:uncharacterized protein LOC115445855 [Manduca sexta]|uniref:uncharacterized protein LOC115445855 n=1 Tax=Manduca sexta TaxID=7130 RepID=UPI00188FBE4E|nr:uncharacterized protein LOC115445855 [Manduca sexta]